MERYFPLFCPFPKPFKDFNNSNTLAVSSNLPSIQQISPAAVATQISPSAVATLTSTKIPAKQCYTSDPKGDLSTENKILPHFKYHMDVAHYYHPFNADLTSLLSQLTQENLNIGPAQKVHQFITYTTKEALQTYPNLKSTINLVIKKSDSIMQDIYQKSNHLLANFMIKSIQNLPISVTKSTTKLKTPTASGNNTQFFPSAPQTTTSVPASTPTNGGGGYPSQPSQPNAPQSSVPTSGGHAPPSTNPAEGAAPSAPGGGGGDDDDDSSSSSSDSSG